MAIEIVNCPIKNGGSFQLWDSLPEANSIKMPDLGTATPCHPNSVPHRAITVVEDRPTAHGICETILHQSTWRVANLSCHDQETWGTKDSRIYRNLQWGSVPCWGIAQGLGAHRLLSPTEKSLTNLRKCTASFCQRWFFRDHQKATD